MIARYPAIRIVSLALLGLSAPLLAQVHYRDDGQPWKQHAPSGPDAEVPGWFYNLGITGLRCIADRTSWLENIPRAPAGCAAESACCDPNPAGLSRPQG
jgi:hypothetical protein